MKNPWKSGDRIASRYAKRMYGTVGRTTDFESSVLWDDGTTGTIMPSDVRPTASVRLATVTPLGDGRYNIRMQWESYDHSTWSLAEAKAVAERRARAGHVGPLTWRRYRVDRVDRPLETSYVLYVNEEDE